MPRRARANGHANGAAYPWLPKNLSVDTLHSALLDGKRAALGKIASLVRFKKGASIYRAGQRAEKFYVIVSGNIAAFEPSKSSKKYITAFLYPTDLFGFAERGRYTLSTVALNAVVAYALPTSVLQRPPAGADDVYFYLIAKVCDQLRRMRHHSLILAQLHINAKLTMFLQMQKQLQAARGERGSAIYLPMSRSNIADYIGVSLAALSRAFGSLAARRIIRYADRRHVQIVNARAFEKLAGSATSNGRISL